MKPIQKVVLQNLFWSKSFYLFLVIVALFAAKTVIHVAHQDINDLQSQTSPLFDLYYGTVNDKLIELLFIPFFLLQLGITSAIFDNYKVLLKYSSAQQWWNEKILSSVLFAGVCTLSIQVIVVGAVIVSGHARDIHSTFVEFLLLGCLLQLIGFSIVGVFYQLIVLRFAQKYVGFLVTVLGILLLEVTKKIFKLTFITLQEYVSMVYKANMGQLTVSSADMIPVVCLLFAFVALYVIGVFQSRDKDFYWSE